MDEVSAAQAAILAGCSERTIRRKIASGALPARRIAANRFAIDVRHLAVRVDARELTHRLEALERRVALLEERQRSHPESLYLAVPASGAAAEEMSGEEAAASSATLNQVLAQLAHEVERLGPLLAPDAPHTGGERRQHGPRSHSRPLPGSGEDIQNVAE